MRELTIMTSTQADNFLRRYNATFLKDHIPKWTWQELLHTEDPERGVTKQDDYRLQNHPGTGSIRDPQNDYKKFIPKISNGITKKGTELINQSIESYLYCILGAQSRAKQPIISNRASALEVQSIFRNIFEDSVINYNTLTWINNMNKAILSTNVVLNMAISPSLWLIRSNLIILKNPVKGCNNKLQVATTNMKFGVNEKINYFEQHQELNILKDKSSPTKEHQELNILKDKSSPTKKHNSKADSDLTIILLLSTLSGYIFSKYVL